MAKKKKLTTEDTIEEKKITTVDTIEEAVEESKKAVTALKGLLAKVTAGHGSFKRVIEEEEKIEPQLTYAKSQIVEDYLMENVPITKRVKGSPKERTPLVSTQEVEEGAVEIAEPVEPPPGPPPSPPPGPPPAVAPSYQLEIYEKLTDFFKGFIGSYNKRYQTWENSISNILSILRKMRKITKKNTEDLVDSITNMYEKVEVGLDQFKTKRDEIEKIADINIQDLSGEFKRVLGMLELQIKEYQLKKETDGYVRDLHLFTS